MPDKLTDNEILKALECCDNCFCGHCVYQPKINCREELSHDVLDLINRLQAENERLKRHTKMHDEIKAEAYKECIEKVKEKALSHYFDNVVLSVRIDDLDNLLKEMVGEDK